MRWGVRIGVALAASLALAGSLSPAAAFAEAYVVDDVGDQLDGGPANDFGCLLLSPDECTLREAITVANSHLGPDSVVITAALEDQTTHVGSPLPTLSQKTTISAVAGLFTLEGSDPEFGGVGLTLGAGAANSTISDLAFVEFAEAIDLNSADGTHIEGVRIGFRANGSAGQIGAPMTPDGDGNGIDLDEADNVVIGGTAPGQGNTISNVIGDGIHIRPNSAGVQVVGNTLGLNPGELGNGSATSGAGVRTEGPDTLVTANRLAGNGQGVFVFGSLASGALIRSNVIGLNKLNQAVTNAAGVVVSSGASAIIGGPASADGNTISGNTVGVQVGNAGAVLIQNNTIGLDPSGLSPIPNTYAGAWTTSGSGVQIGTAGAGNLISGNGAGVVLGGQDNRVEGNVIGLNRAGDPAPNGDGVRFGDPVSKATNNVVGSPAAPNTISGNTGDGVSLPDPDATGNTISSNLIGTDSTGETSHPNGDSGVEISQGSNNIVEANLVSSNVGAGIAVSATPGPAPHDNIIRNNVVGLNAAQTFPLPNARGVLAGGTNDLYLGNVIAGNAAEGLRLGAGAQGNRVEGNAITNNRGDGIAAPDAGTSNAFAENSIFGNDGLGIDLGLDGVTANDTEDADTGANGLQNVPELSAVTVSGTGASAVGTFTSVPLVRVTIRFFTSNTCDASGSGEGQTPAGSVDTATDLSGSGSFIVPITATAGQQVTATATSPDGTSEFSACREALAAAVPAACQGREATITGTEAADKIKGTGGKDVISGLGGNDRINGLGGADIVCGDGGNDKLAGGGGKDKLDGGGGRDRLNGGSGAGDVCKGGSGKDIAAASCERRRSA